MNTWFSEEHLTGTPGGAASARPSSTELIGIRPYIVLIALLCLATVGLVTWRMIYVGQQRVIEHQALEVAEVVARGALTARSVYAAQIVSKLKKDGFGAHDDYESRPGYVPLPAQFLKMFGRQISADNDGLFSYKPVSKWNLEPTQGLSDEFQRWAWPQLEAQDQEAPTGPIEWKPIWRIEDVDGTRTLRYLRPDAASGQSCVSCHNQNEAMESVRERRLAQGTLPGKQWRRYQLLGAIDVSIPLSQVEVFAAVQNRITLAVIIGAVSTGVIILGFLVSLDVVRSRRMAHELSWRANHDTLTELASRGAFEQRAYELVEQARTDGGVHALLFMDLDQFKVVNDTCGHIAGDELLRQLSAVLKGYIRASDMLARLGGDEFGVLLAGCLPQKAVEIAGQLHAAVQRFRFTWENKAFTVGISIGLVQISKETESIAAIMSQADLACYAAKDAGRNRIHIFSNTDAEISRRRSEMEWVSRITQALDHGRISLAVQDACSLNAGAPSTLYREILLRMLDEEQKPVPTVTLIAAAERYNFMPTLDRWVVRTVLGAVARGDLPIKGDDIVAINLSGTSLNDERFLDFMLDQIGCLPDGMAPHICFEITETAAVNSIAHAQRFMATVRSRGCKFALDDFGAGLSSLVYLKNLPVNFIKIEGTFVRDILSDPIDLALVEAVCHIGRATGAKLIAEWVESEALHERVRALGIDYAQGNAVAPPKPLSLLTPSEIHESNGTASKHASRRLNVQRGIVAWDVDFRNG